MTFSYDNLGRLLAASDATGLARSYGYDALGRATSESGAYGGTLASQYDAAGRRTRLTWPDNFYVQYDYDSAGEIVAVRENGATSGVGVLASYAYDDLGRRTSLTRGNGTTTTYGYNAAGQLVSLAHDLAGTAYDQAWTYGYNPAGQIVTRTSSNDLYAWTGAVAVARPYASNGLNQYSTSGATSLGYDARGNLNLSGSNAYGYDSRNDQTTFPGGTATTDPTGAMVKLTGENVGFVYDHGAITGETSLSNTLLRRYVYGADADAPLVWYEGSVTRR